MDEVSSSCIRLEWESIRCSCRQRHWREFPPKWTPVKLTALITAVEQEDLAVPTDGGTNQRQDLSRKSMSPHRILKLDRGAHLAEDVSRPQKQGSVTPGHRAGTPVSPVTGSDRADGTPHVRVFPPAAKNPSRHGELTRR